MKIYPDLIRGSIKLNTAIKERALVRCVRIACVEKEKIVNHLMAPYMEASDLERIGRNIFAATPSSVKLAREDR
ncbi:MAG: hypothetical protein ABGX83_02890, partial [Nitrospira sp.]